jgi:phage terminase large subunit GpA-like protein
VSADPSTIGFHLSALYSPAGWLSWERIARAWEAAQGSDEAIRAFRNTILGETWVETGEARTGGSSTTAASAGRPGRCPRAG